MTRTYLLTAAVASLFVLVACGGGGVSPNTDLFIQQENVQNQGQTPLVNDDAIETAGDGSVDDLGGSGANLGGSGDTGDTVQPVFAGVNPDAGINPVAFANEPNAPVQGGATGQSSHTLLSNATPPAQPADYQLCVDNPVLAPYFCAIVIQSYCGTPITAFIANLHDPLCMISDDYDAARNEHCGPAGDKNVGCPGYVTCAMAPFNATAIDNDDNNCAPEQRMACAASPTADDTCATVANDYCAINDDRLFEDICNINAANFDNHDQARIDACLNLDSGLTDNGRFDCDEEGGPLELACDGNGGAIVANPFAQKTMSGQDPITICIGPSLIEDKSYADLRVEQCAANLVTAGTYANATDALCKAEAVALCAGGNLFTETLCNDEYGLDYADARQTACITNDTAKGASPENCGTEAEATSIIGIYCAQTAATALTHNVTCPAKFATAPTDSSPTTVTHSDWANSVDENGKIIPATPPPGNSFLRIDDPRTEAVETQLSELGTRAANLSGSGGMRIQQRTRPGDASNQDGYQHFAFIAAQRSGARYFAGILPSTDLGAPISDGRFNTTWTGGVFTVIRNATVIQRAFELEVEWTGNGEGDAIGTAVGFTALFDGNDNYRMFLDGTFNAAGVITGDATLADFTDADRGMAVSTSGGGQAGNYGTGPLRGLIGADGAVGVFHVGTSVHIADSQGIHGQGNFAGGFAVNSARATTMTVDSTPNAAAYNDWVGSFGAGQVNEGTLLGATGVADIAGGDLNGIASHYIQAPSPLRVTGELGNYLLDLNLLTGVSGAAGQVALAYDNPTDGSDQLFAGLVTGANVGAVLDSPSQSATWYGKVSFIALDALAHVVNQDIGLAITYTGASADNQGTIATLPSTTFIATATVGGSDISQEVALSFSGSWNDKGVITGTSTIDANTFDTGSGQSPDRDELTGSLNGLIGANGAIGVFKDNGAGARGFVGGFAVHPNVAAPLPTRFESTTFDRWATHASAIADGAASTSDGTANIIQGHNEFLNLGTHMDAKITPDTGTDIAYRIGSTTGNNGFALAAWTTGGETQLYAGLLAGTNLGGLPTGRTNDRATWNGKLRFLRYETDISSATAGTTLSEEIDYEVAFRIANAERETVLLTFTRTKIFDDDGAETWLEQFFTRINNGRTNNDDTGQITTLTNNVDITRSGSTNGSGTIFGIAGTSGGVGTISANIGTTYYVGGFAVAPSFTVSAIAPSGTGGDSPPQGGAVGLGGGANGQGGAGGLSSHSLLTTTETAMPSDDELYTFCMDNRQFATLVCAEVIETYCGTPVAAFTANLFDPLCVANTDFNNARIAYCTTNGAGADPLDTDCVEGIHGAGAGLVNMARRDACVALESAQTTDGRCDDAVLLDDCDTAPFVAGCGARTDIVGLRVAYCADKTRSDVGCLNNTNPNTSERYVTAVAEGRTGAWWGDDNLRNSGGTATIETLHTSNIVTPDATTRVSRYIRGLTSADGRTLTAMGATLTGARHGAITLSDGFIGDAGNDSINRGGVGFILNTAGSNHDTYAGILTNTSLADEVMANEPNGTAHWRGTFRILTTNSFNLDQTRTDDDFQLTITYGNSRTINLVNPVTLADDATFTMTGGYNAQGIIWGTTVFDDIFTNNAGTFSGLIGRVGDNHADNRLIGAFINDVGTDIAYAGGFVAKPRVVLVRGAQFQTWAGSTNTFPSQIGGGAVTILAADRTDTSGDGSYNIIQGGINTLNLRGKDTLAFNGLTLNDVRPGSTTAGFGIARVGGKLYSGLLAGTEVGAALTSEIHVSWPAEIHYLHDDTVHSSFFDLNVAYSEITGTTFTIENRRVDRFTRTGALADTIERQITIDGAVAKDGYLLTGTVTFAEVGVGKNNNGTLFATRYGVLTGLAGTDGLVGAFAGRQDDVATNIFAGGIVSRAPLVYVALDETEGVTDYARWYNSVGVRPAPLVASVLVTKTIMGEDGGEDMEVQVIEGESQLVAVNANNTITPLRGSTAQGQRVLRFKELGDLVTPAQAGTEPISGIAVYSGHSANPGGYFYSAIGLTPGTELGAPADGEPGVVEWRGRAFTYLWANRFLDNRDNRIQAGVILCINLNTQEFASARVNCKRDDAATVGQGVFATDPDTNRSKFRLSFQGKWDKTTGLIKDSSGVVSDEITRFNRAPDAITLTGLVGEDGALGVFHRTTDANGVINHLIGGFAVHRNAPNPGQARYWEENALDTDGSTALAINIVDDFVTTQSGQTFGFLSRLGRDGTGLRLADTTANEPSSRGNGVALADGSASGILTFNTAFGDTVIADHGVGFFRNGGVDGQVGYYAGVLGGTNVGGNGVRSNDINVAFWDAKLAIIAGSGGMREDFDLSLDVDMKLVVDYTMKTIKTSAHPQRRITLASGAEFSISGTYTNEGLIWGTSTLGADTGTLTGLFGSLGGHSGNRAVGVFASSAGAGYVGGFVAKPEEEPVAGSFTRWTRDTRTTLRTAIRDTAGEVNLDFIAGSDTGLTGVTENVGSLRISNLDLKDDKDVVISTAGALSFGTVQVGGETQYYAGLLRDTAVGAVLAEADTNADWNGQLSVYSPNGAITSANFVLEFDFGTTSISIAQRVFGAHSFGLTRTSWDTRTGLLTGAGTVTFDSGNDGINAQVGSLSGLIGKNGAIGVFKADDTTPNAFNPFVGGFVAHKDAPIPRVDYAIWAKTGNTGNDLVPTIPTSDVVTPNTETQQGRFVRGLTRNGAALVVDGFGNALAASSTHGILTLGALEATPTPTDNGVGFFRNGNGATAYFYAGVLSGTDFGAVISTTDTAKWRGQLSIITGDEDAITQEFQLTVDYGARTIDSIMDGANAGAKEFALSTRTNEFFRIEGHYTNIGIVYGTANYRIAGGTDTQTDLTGLIGSIGPGDSDNRLVGAFASATGAFAGGFVAKPPPPLVTYKAWNTASVSDRVSHTHLGGDDLTESAGASFYINGLAGGRPDGTGTKNTDDSAAAWINLRDDDMNDLGAIVFGFVRKNNTENYGYTGLVAPPDDVNLGPVIDHRNLNSVWDGRLGMDSFVANNREDPFLETTDVKFFVEFFGGETRRGRISLVDDDGGVTTISGYGDGGRTRVGNHRKILDTYEFELSAGRNETRTRRLSLVGFWDSKGVIRGRSLYGSTASTTPGSFTGIIGSNGALGVFKSDAVTGSLFAGGFVARPPAPAPDTVDYFDWLNTNPGVQQTSVQRNVEAQFNARSQFLRASETNLVDIELSNIKTTRVVLTLQDADAANGDATDAISYYYIDTFENQRFGYAGILNTTDLGAPLDENSNLNGMWNGRVRMIRPGARLHAAAVPISLDVQFGMGDQAGTITALTEIDSSSGVRQRSLRIRGDFDTNGVITGTTLFANTNSKRDDVSAAADSPGTLRGLIGAEGALGVFISDAEMRQRRPDPDGYVGGFVACPMGGCTAGN